MIIVKSGITDEGNRFCKELSTIEIPIDLTEIVFDIIQQNSQRFNIIHKKAIIYKKATVT